MQNLHKLSFKKLLQGGNHLCCCLLISSLVSTQVLASTSQFDSDQNSSPLLFSKQFSVLGKLTDTERTWIGDKVYQNECASKPHNLTYWGKGEDFPSFGVGHFIWYPSGVEETFQETFPDSLRI